MKPKKTTLAVLLCLMTLMAGCATISPPEPEPSAQQSMLDQEYRAAREALNRAQQAQGPQYRPDLYQRASDMLQRLRQQQQESPDDALVAEYRQVQILAYEAAVGALSDRLDEARQQTQAAEAPPESGRILPTEAETPQGAAPGNGQKIKTLRNQLQQAREAKQQLEQTVENQNQQISQLREDKELLRGWFDDQASSLRELHAENEQLRNRLDQLGEREREIQQENDQITEESRKKLDQADVRREEDEVILNYQENILFDLGSAYIKKRGQQTLQKVARVLKNYPDRMIRIEGHTDTNPIQTPRYPTNWELSTHRATNVLRFLIDKGGIDKMRISAVGYGEYHPLVPNTTAENRAKNRRVEIVLYPREDRPLKVISGP